ncbi:cytochrome P450 [Xylaria bambusicola]|uniref:cytochrome P450 n=1 Tax=Xylaria bambusicola TaxID=326684 RepID=UPI0020075084|nr:cytochrome P450 [Xylaria bambusicola]KAI0508722.1 cytochrome P450 [Xylaria bambusicola]
MESHCNIWLSRYLFSITIVFMAVIYATILRLYPRPIPGVPYNLYATKRITGDLVEVQARQKAVGSIRPWFLEQAQRHGSAIVQIFLGPFAPPAILLSDYREVYDILTYRAADFQRGKKVEVFKGILPHAYPSMESFDPKYKDGRAIMKGLMTPSFLQSVSASQLYRVNVELLELWRLKCHMSRGRPFDIADDILTFSFDAILSTATGPPDSGGDLQHQMSNLQLHAEKLTSITRKMASVDEPISFPVTSPSPVRKALSVEEESLWKGFYMPSPRLYHWFNNLRPAVRKSRQTMRTFISARIETSALNIRKGYDPQCALDYILRGQVHDAEKVGRSPVFEDPRIRDSIYGYIIAGHDTSAGSLLWLLTQLVAYQAEQKRVREDLYNTYSAAWAENRLPTVSELSKPAPYLNAFIEEVLRVNCPVVTIMVNTRRDTTILGYQIPKHTAVFLNLTGSSLSEPSVPVEESLRSPTSRSCASRRGNWDKADSTKFSPSRWLRQTSDGKLIFDRSSGPTLSFSSGERGCWGRSLGYLELRIMLTLLLWTFELREIPECLRSVETYDSLVTAPKHCFIRLSEIVPGKGQAA